MLSPGREWLTEQRGRLDSWEAKVGLPPHKMPLYRDEAVHYLELLSGDRKKLTPDECAEAAVVLSQYAAHLTREAQREEADAVLLKERVRQVVRDRLAQQKGYGLEERMLMAVAEDKAAGDLDGLRVAAEVKAKRLAYFSNRVDRVSQAYRDLANARKRERQYGD